MLPVGRPPRARYRAHLSDPPSPSYAQILDPREDESQHRSQTSELAERDFVPFSDFGPSGWDARGQIPKACSGKIVKVLMERWMSYKNECMHTISTDPPATGEAFR
ncbi:hypothetical protein Z043_120500 [Scleropages formosus]|uniref:Uncharacterized protein n=1 Tax=Scleropages formosus TaxID=113540 RepID=A0A0P7UPD2_SCLFO|nr:hypothetical protein Z043_120500 [Scleropages formosus]